MKTTPFLLATAIAVGAAGAAHAAIVANPNFAPTDITGLTIQNWAPTANNVPGNAPYTGSAESLFNTNPTLQLTTGVWNNGSVPDGQHGVDGYQGTVGFETVGYQPFVGLSQVLTLTSGQTYTLSLYANADLGNTVSIQALIGSTTVLAATTASNDVFTLLTSTFVAPTGSHTIEIDALAVGGLPATLLLADVTIAPVTPVATPEPTSLALLGAGLAVTGLIRRRRA